MIPINESKIFCLYCRGEILPKDANQMLSSELQQYHQTCFDEIIKDNHCELCSKLLNELNTFFTEQNIRIHQKCNEELTNILTQKLKVIVDDYLKEIPLKILAKNYLFYQMKEENFNTYIEDLSKLINSRLPNFSSKSDFFQVYYAKLSDETVRNIIAEYIENAVQVELDIELQKCRSQAKKEVVEKILIFVWKYYLEIPISYKDRINHKIMLSPSMDNVNCTIFHFKLEQLFSTQLDFNAITNRNFNDILDYLLQEPISIQKFRFNNHEIKAQ